jgi:hypothetical protein
MQIPHGFKIKKKVDVETFINKCMCKGNRYYIITDSGEQITFDKDKNGNVSVLSRTGDLTDMFNPNMEIARTNKNCYKNTVEDCIWKNRKYINAKWFTEEK